MTERKKKIVIIGAGPAGLGAAKAAYDGGVKDIVILERDDYAGGILNQCIHNGFGLHTFKEELTGPEYAARFETEITSRGIECSFNTTVLSVSPNRIVTAVSPAGIIHYDADAVILACGCRERPRGAVNIAGSRPSGIFSAGTAQRLINIEGRHIGNDVFILGSGDIGLIMARRMTFEGADVKGVAELMPYSSGLNRNIAQCLNDFDIPLMLSTTVVDIKGKGRLSSVVIADVENKTPIAGSEREIKCDTLLLSVGLLPENELARACGVQMASATGGAKVGDDFMTSVDGVFMCGNCLHVHDLVDYVSSEAALTGYAAAKYVQSGKKQGSKTEVVTSGGLRYCVPQYISKEGVGALTLRMRADNVYRKCEIAIECDGKSVYNRKRPIVTPGEMETIELDAEKSALLRDAEKIEVKLIK